MVNWWWHILEPLHPFTRPETDSNPDAYDGDDEGDDHEEDVVVQHNPEYYESLWKHYIQPHFLVVRPQPRGIHRVPARPNLSRRWIVCVCP